MINGTPLFLQETLDDNRIKLLKYFSLIKDLGFYLAGGTSLALQLGHRQSIDFDFFINSDFDENQLFEKMLEIFKNEDIKKTFSEKNTLYIEVNEIKISFFGYKYNLIGNLIKTDYFNLASINDISAMKIWAILKRATKKDYVDIYYILQKLTLRDFLNNFYEKFGNIVTETLILKGLVYFDDILDEDIILNNKNIDFEKIKESLKDKVKNYEIKKQNSSRG